MNNQEQPIKKPRSKWLTLIIVIIGIAILGLIIWGGYILFKPAPSEEPIVEDEFKDWKIYTDGKFGFNFKYPLNWKCNLELDYSLEYLLQRGNTRLDALRRSIKCRGEPFEKIIEKGGTLASMEIDILRSSEEKDIIAWLVQYDYELNNLEKPNYKIANTNAIKFYYQALWYDMPQNYESLFVAFIKDNRPILIKGNTGEENYGKATIEKILTTFKFIK